MDVQISLDGATAEVNDAVRGAGSYAMAVRALQNLARRASARPEPPRSRWWSPGTMSASSTNSPRWQAVTAPPADHPAAPVGRAPMSGRPAPTAAQQVQLYDWLVLNGERVLTAIPSSTFPAGESVRWPVSTCAAPVGWSA
ncbi:putative pqqE [Mycobacterium kansasii]|uniref:Putative pqqE n=1 Tax=Mycobacterium kansasii TaxID=1768 RepID=A0A1V3WA35_MYCKA|nr:putative pqqE [Mycobacterium kansasii]